MSICCQWRPRLLQIVARRELRVPRRSLTSVYFAQPYTSGFCHTVLATEWSVSRYDRRFHVDSLPLSHAIQRPFASQTGKLKKKLKRKGTSASKDAKDGNTSVKRRVPKREKKKCANDEDSKHRHRGKRMRENAPKRVKTNAEYAKSRRERTQQKKLMQAPNNNTDNRGAATVSDDRNEQISYNWIRRLATAWTTPSVAAIHHPAVQAVLGGHERNKASGTARVVHKENLNAKESSSTAIRTKEKAVQNMKNGVVTDDFPGAVDVAIAGTSDSNQSENEGFVVKHARHVSTDVIEETLEEHTPDGVAIENSENGTSGNASPTDETKKSAKEIPWWSTKSS